MGTPAELSDRDRREALALAGRIVASVTDDLTFPLAIGDQSTMYLILIMSQYLLELAGASVKVPIKMHAFELSIKTGRCAVCDRPDYWPLHNQDADH